MRDQEISFPEAEAIGYLDILLEKHRPWYPNRYDTVRKQFEANHLYRLNQIDSLPFDDPILEKVYKRCYQQVHALSQRGRESRRKLFRKWSLLLNHLYGIAMLQEVAYDLLAAFTGETDEGKGVLRKTDLTCLDMAVELMDSPSIDWDHQRKIEQTKGGHSVQSEYLLARTKAHDIQSRLAILRKDKAPGGGEGRYDILPSEIKALKTLRDIAWDRITTGPLQAEGAYDEGLSLDSGSHSLTGSLPNGPAGEGTLSLYLQEQPPWSQFDDASQEGSRPPSERRLSSRLSAIFSVGRSSKGRSSRATSISENAHDSNRSNSKDKGKSAFRVYRKWLKRHIGAAQKSPPFGPTTSSRGQCPDLEDLDGTRTPVKHDGGLKPMEAADGNSLMDPTAYSGAQFSHLGSSNLGGTSFEDVEDSEEFERSLANVGAPSKRNQERSRRFSTGSSGSSESSGSEGTMTQSTYLTRVGSTNTGYLTGVGLANTGSIPTYAQTLELVP